MATHFEPLLFLRSFQQIFVTLNFFALKIHSLMFRGHKFCTSDTIHIGNYFSRHRFSPLTYSSAASRSVARKKHYAKKHYVRENQLTSWFTGGRRLETGCGCYSQNDVSMSHSLYVGHAFC